MATAASSHRSLVSRSLSRTERTTSLFHRIVLFVLQLDSSGLLCYPSVLWGGLTAFPIPKTHYSLLAICGSEPNTFTSVHPTIKIITNQQAPASSPLQVNCRYLKRYQIILKNTMTGKPIIAILLYQFGLSTNILHTRDKTCIEITLPNAALRLITTIETSIADILLLLSPYN